MNFVIYEDDKQYVLLYKEVINKLMGYSNVSYKTIEINKWDDKAKNKMENIHGNKIFILDVEVSGKTGIDLARMIRNNGDWISPIIVVTSHEEFKMVGYTSKVLMLDFILKQEDVCGRLSESLKLALEINGTKKVYSFLQKGEMYKIPLEDILYVEKNLNDNCSFIVTNEHKYLVRKSIVNIEKELKDMNFCKTHRSCLVNLDNITHIDFDNGVIFFDKKEINLLSRANKKLLKERVGYING